MRPSPRRSLAALAAIGGHEARVVRVVATGAVGLEHHGVDGPDGPDERVGNPDLARGQFLERVGDVDPPVPARCAGVEHRVEILAQGLRHQPVVGHVEAGLLPRKLMQPGCLGPGDVVADQAEVQVGHGE